MALDEHGGDNVVARAEIRDELVDQVAMIGPDPQVMVRVDDGQVGFEDRLHCCLASHAALGGVILPNSVAMAGSMPQIRYAGARRRRNG